MALARDTINAVKERADIVEVIGERVHLQSSGDGYVGLCPFHGEKTPSFRVSPTYRTYHCFGCGVGGSVVDFLMATEHLSFPEAVRALADRYGVPLPDDNRADEPSNRGRDALAAGEAYYREVLLSRPEGEPARRYLRERGFDEADWEAFGLGYALDAWQGFLHHGKGLGFTDEDLLDSGLVRRSQGGRLFDMLRGRVVFPIRDERGRPIAFGGRVLAGGDGPKYLNTAETRHYRKSRVLFGLAQGLPALRASRRAVLVEGYLDVMRLHQHGLQEAVATCGTALSAEHLKLLERHAERVVLLFDGDEAGVKAALRSAPLFLDRGIEARVVLLPDGQDPDDFLARQGLAPFQALLDDAAPILEFLVFQLAQRHGNSLQGRQQTLDALMPVLAEVRKPAARDLTVRFVADLVGVGADTVLGMVGPGRMQEAAPPSTPAPQALLPREGRHERRALRLLLEQPGMLVRARTLLQPQDLRDAELRALLERLLGFADAECPALNAQELIEWFPEHAATLRMLLMEDGLHTNAVSDPERQLEGEVLGIKEELKAELFRRLKQVAGTQQEELALRRYTQVRDELAVLRNSLRKTIRPRPELSLREKADPA